MLLPIGALAGTTLLGFIAGLFTFKVKSRWCPCCGATTTAHPPTDHTARNGYPPANRPTHWTATNDRASQRGDTQRLHRNDRHTRTP